MFVERTEQRGLDRQPSSEFRRGERHGPARGRDQYVLGANWYGHAGGRDVASQSGRSRGTGADPNAYSYSHADSDSYADAAAYSYSYADAYADTDSGSDPSTEPNARALHVWCVTVSDLD